MSETELKTDDKVPTEVICTRLDELADAVTKGDAGLRREFYMSIPAAPHRDADLVLSEAARRLRAVQSVLPNLDTRADQPRPAAQPERGMERHYAEKLLRKIRLCETDQDATGVLAKALQPRPAVPDDWQPIETAPRDGKSILVWCPEYLCTYCVRWDELFSTWQIFGGMSLHFRPTLWTSTPEPTWAAQQPEGGDDETV